MANDVIVTVSMSVKPELETLLSMIPGLHAVPPMQVTDHVRRLAGREPVPFRAFVETCRADLTPDA
jgi:hypothetical protein